MINRRSFLEFTVGAAVAALGRRGYCAATKRNLRKAIMYSTIGVKGSVLEKFRAMKEAGFEGVEPMGGLNREEVIAASKRPGWRPRASAATRIGKNRFRRRMKQIGRAHV